MDYKVIYKEVGRNPKTTHFYNAKSESQVIEHFGLNDPEIEYYKLEKLLNNDSSRVNKHIELYW